MARQHTLLRQAQKVAAAVPAFAGIALLSGPPQEGASALCLLVGTAEKYAFRLLLDILPAAARAFQGCASDSFWSSLNAGHLIVTGLHFLRVVCGAA